MAPPQKGKQATKGAKQILEENRTTLIFYRNMALGSACISLLINFLFLDLSKCTMVMSLLSLVILGAAYQFMAYMSKPSYTETASLIDPGNDLNLEGGVAENVKDLVILTSGTMLLSILSNYFWLILLLAPLRAFWMLWTSIIKPWLGQKNSNEDVEVNQKKQRKMERKLRKVR